jgi:hypothetical protein
MGKTHIFINSGGSGIISQNSNVSTSILSGTSTSDNFGYSVSIGDVNGDGFADICVGANNIGAGIGKSFLFKSNGSSGIASMNSTSANAILSGTFSGGAFGNSVLFRDINGDGLDDLIIGSYWTATNGRVYIFQSPSSSGITSQNDTAATNILTGTNTAQFGINTSMNDINGDGYPDLLVVSRAANNGKIYFFLNGSSGITDLNDSNANAVLTGTITGQFGNALH